MQEEEGTQVVEGVAKRIKAAKIDQAETQGYIQLQQPTN